MRANIVTMSMKMSRSRMMIVITCHDKNGGATDVPLRGNLKLFGCNKMC